MISKRYIIFISIFYGVLVGAGYYGYSNDYYAEYYQSNVLYSKFYDKLGSLLSTLTIFETHIGVYITSLTLALSTGFIFRTFFNEIKKNNILFFIIIFILTLHTHPIIMSTSGAMRQGWAMSCLFISIIFLLENKKKLSYFFIFLSIFMHKSGLILFSIYNATYVITYLLQKIKNKNNHIIFILLTGFLIFLLSCVVLNSTGWTTIDTKIVAGDFRFLWLIINLSYVVLYIVSFKNKRLSCLKQIYLLFYIQTCSTMAFLYMGLNWQYERLNMITAIPLILIISLFFKKNFYLYLSLAMCTYLFITIYQGMYSIGLT